MQIKINCYISVSGFVKSAVTERNLLRQTGANGGKFMWYVSVN